jgi:UDP-glucose 4-epimerase
MKALVTGSAGFIGGHLVEELKRNSYDVAGFDKAQGDITSFQFDKILEDTEVIFHLAGLLGTSELFHRILDAEKVNVLGTLNLLEAMRRRDVDKIVFTSKPNVWKHNVYTITKENCERYLEMYREIYGFKVVICRPFNVYGPGEYLTEYRKAIPYFILAMLQHDPVEIYGNGKQTLDAIYVDDVTAALRLCAEKLPRETVQVGSGTPIPVNDLAGLIFRKIQSRSEIVHIRRRKGEADIERICADDSMNRLIAFKPQVSLEDGLDMTIDWYRKHLEQFAVIYKPAEDEFQK